MNRAKTIMNVMESRDGDVDVRKRGRNMLGFRDEGQITTPRNHDRASTNMAG
jgi:hypothetical protein